MSVNLDCPNRIKPKLLREHKTEALLIFIRTTLEQYFKDLDENKIHFQMGTNDDNEVLENALRWLLAQFQDCVVNSTYIRSIISSAHISQAMSMLAKKEEPVMVYYDAIINQMQKSLLQGQNWIPEQLVVCLLSEWVIEEEKPTILYPFLKEINYLELLTRYDNVREEAKEEKDWNKTAAIMNMYKVGSDLIHRLKNTTYKINTKRVSKTRKKRK
ncbi:MAG TPA: hypothetical protein EYG73_10820 [Arcobacter sp.]|nr:hypothetical protein [Arcobacter sp.]